MDEDTSKIPLPDFGQVSRVIKSKRNYWNRTGWLVIGLSAFSLVTAVYHVKDGGVRFDYILEKTDASRVNDPSKYHFEYLASTQVIVSTNASQSVPATWNNSSNTIHAIGAGSKGLTGGVNTGCGPQPGAGGGGGAYATKSNVSLTLGGTFAVTIGAQNSGTDTNVASGQVIAKAAAANSKTGGAAASCTPVTGAQNGGTGNSRGGGGAGGPNGAGNNSSSTTGGSGDAGFGGAGGASGVAGSAGTEIGGSGSGSGGGGGAGAAAGNYGAGGGGGATCGGIGGNGAPGVVILVWTPASVTQKLNSYTRASMFRASYW